MNALKKLFFSNTSKKQTLLKNNFWLFLGETISKLLKFFIVTAGARILGVADFGKFNYVLNTVTILTILSDLGINNIYIREYNKDPEKDHLLLPNFISLKTLLVLINTGIILLFSVFFAPDMITKKLFWILGLFGIMEQIYFAVTGIFSSRQIMEFDGIGKILKSKAVTGLGLLVILFIPQLPWYSAAYTVSSILGVIFITIVFLVKNGLPGFKIDFKTWGFFLKFSWPLALTMLFSKLYHLLDSAIMGAMGLMKDTGYYSAAYKLIDIIIIPTGIISVAFFPLLAQSFGKDGTEKQKKDIFSRQLSLYICLFVPILFGGYLLAPDIIRLIYDSSYLPSVPVFRILLFGVVGISFLSISYQKFLIAANLQKYVFIPTMTAGVLNTILNILLIPKYGMMGASWATVVCYGVEFAFYIVFIHRIVKISPWTPFAMEILFTAILSTLGMYLFLKIPFVQARSILLSIPLSMIIYGIIFLLMEKLVFKRDLRKRLFSKDIREN